MSSIIQYPAIRGKLGTTEYYTFVIKARELASATEITSPDKWHDIKVDELIQRKLDHKRVISHIAPYLADKKDRFFGAVVLFTEKKLHFTPFDKLLAGELSPIFQSIKSELNNMGILTLESGGEWNPLDGQHRIEAIRCAIRGKDHTGKDIKDFEASRDLGDEDVTVIMIADCDTQKARNIFTKINRHARKTSAGDNLLMDDDDIIAVLSREIGSDICGGRLIATSKNDIGDNERFFTTLKCLEQANLSILKWHYGDKINRGELPSKDTCKLLERKLRDAWTHLAMHIEHFAAALVDKEETGDKKRMEIRKNFLLLKPVPQMAMIEAFSRLTGKQPNGQPMTFENASNRLNKINWDKSAPEWDRVLMSGGKILRKLKLATDLIYYMAGGKFNDGEEEKFLQRYRDEFPQDEQANKQLPAKVKV